MSNGAKFQHRLIGLFLLETVSSLISPNLSRASYGIKQSKLITYNLVDLLNKKGFDIIVDKCLYGQGSELFDLKKYWFLSSLCYNGIGTVTCLWQPTQANKQYQCQFTVALAKNGQEIENQYITQKSLYTHTLQYLEGDITHDIYLHLLGRPDSVAANSATYLRQYGTTGHSTVLLTFPVAEKLLRQGCRLSFRSRQLDLQARQFVFTARDFKHIHQN